MKQEITSLYNEIAERNQTINEKVIIHLEFCETRTKRNVEVYRVKIWTPPSTNVTDILKATHHRP
jgi:hypothetical protein